MKGAYWSNVELREIAEVVTGTTPPTADESNYGKGTPFVTPTELVGYEPITQSRAYLTKRGAEQARLLPAGSVLVCCIGSLGKIGISGVPLVSNQQINALIPKKNVVDSRYLLHACARLKNTLETIAPSTTVKIVNKSRFSELQIPLPPLEEQRRIAAILDKADALRQKRRLALHKLDSLTQSIFFDMFGDPARNPKKWAVCDLGAFIIDGPQNGLYKPAENYGSGTPILRIDAFYDGEISDLSALKRVRLTEKEIESYGLRENDLIVNRVNSREYLGKSAIVTDLVEPTVFESNMMRFRVAAHLLNPHFAIAMLQTGFIKSQILRGCKDAVNQSSINQDDVKSFTLFLPPIELQEEFARIAAIIKMRLLRSRYAEEIVENFFHSVQHRAFRGDLVLPMVAV